MRMESAYAPILDDRLTFGLKYIEPESVRPCKGTIFVVLPDKQTKTEGGVILPGTMDIPSEIARVASVPVPCDEKCPVVVGDWVIFRAGVYELAPFGGRTDLAVLQYTDEVDTQVLGVIRGPDMEEAMIRRDEATAEIRNFEEKTAILV